LIPARGGSKGLPGKNLAKLGDIPLVGRTVRAARNVANAFPGSRVVCSTDDPSISAAAREWGAETPFVRPAELATDQARTIDVVIHALDVLDQAFDAVVLLQPTTPLTEPRDIQGALDLFLETRTPVISVCSAEHPVEWYHRIDDIGRLIPILQPAGADRRQKTEPSYRPNGAVYVASVEHVRGGGFWTPDTKAFIMPMERSVDIDTELDLAMAQTLLAQQSTPPTRTGACGVVMKTPLVILGAGGFGREVHDVVEAMNDAAAISNDQTFDFLGFIDNQLADAGLLEERGAPLLGGDDVLDTLPAGTHYVIAIGDGRVRRALDEKATAIGLKAATLVHPAATVGKHLVVLGPGTIICSHVSITTNVRLGRHVHLNLNVTVGHEAVLGDYVTVNPGANISGNVILEDEVMIGTGAALIPGVTVGAGSVIGAGACVVRSIPSGVTAVGMPAKPIGATR